MTNNTIREKRRLAFNFKKLTPTDIRALSDVLEQEVNILSSTEINRDYILYSLDTVDNSSFESRSNIIFKENGIIDTKVANKISMRFYNADYSKNIEIQIYHTFEKDKLDNFIVVSGDDTIWVNGVLARLSDIIKNVENQSTFNNRIAGWAIFILFILFNVEYFRLFFQYFDKSNELVLTLLMVGVPLVSMIYAFKLAEYVGKAWPYVELQTGPKHSQIAFRKRTNLMWIVSSIILPILLAIIYDISKNYI